MNRERRRVLFLQMPLPDNDPAGEGERIGLAAAYLCYAMERAGESRYFEPVLAGSELDGLDNANTVDSILALRPYAIAATLYVWNIERTLRILSTVRRVLPGVKVLCGGPEVAWPHPFLFRTRVADVVVTGEGEPVFGPILGALRLGRRTDFTNVAWLVDGAYRRGRRPPPSPALSVLLPPARHAVNRPDTKGMGYLEASRGCPSRCTFCCYRQHRADVSRLSVREILARIRVLRRRGAREIRFIDPTFNARPDFVELLTAVARLNADRSLEFFAELRADTITPSIADLLVGANVRHIEVGVQSSEPAVLRAIGRAAGIGRVFNGIELLAERGLGTTLDVMCGLPNQTADDVRNTVNRLARVRGGNVQLLHTLLIPGTALRERRARYGLKAQPRPPYRVLSTPAMTEADIAAADESAARRLGARHDSPARRFVGFRLPDLFPEKVHGDLGAAAAATAPPGRESRRAVIFRDDDLYGVRDAVLATVRSAIHAEPDMLWQFVLCPAHEEPLDLLDLMIQTIDQAPDHFVDRLHVRREGTGRVARRVFVMLRHGVRYDASWRDAAEELLARAFY